MLLGNQRESVSEIHAAGFHTVHPELRANLSIFRSKKEQITIELDADLVTAYRSTGRGYQTRINRDLRRAAEVNGILKLAERFSARKSVG